MVDLALKTLLHDKLRFAITILGVAFAVTLVLVQSGLFLGLLSYSTVTIEEPIADLWITSKNTPNIDFAHTFPESYVERVRSVPGVARADNLILSFMQISLPTGVQEGVLVYGIEDGLAWHLPWNVVEGDLSDLRRGNFLFLDDSATKRLGAFHVGERREILGTRLEIAGRTREARSFTTTPIAFLDYRLAQDLNPGVLRSQTTYTLVKLEPGAVVETVRREIQARLPFNDVFTKAEWANRSRSYWIASTGLGLNMFLTVFLGCLVGTVVVAQTLYTSTMEHLREFGTVKAIGGSNADIYLILARQALVAALAGYVVGLFPALGVARLVARADLRLTVTPEVAGAVFVGTVVLCLAASAISFRKVAGIDPALVFRG